MRKTIKIKDMDIDKLTMRCGACGIILLYGVLAIGILGSIVAMIYLIANCIFC